MPKSIWKGEISFGLVSIPVSLISIEENNDIHFHLLDSKTHSRIRYKRVNENTGKEVPWKDIVKGYEYDKDNYIIVDETQFEKASPEIFKSIDIEEFVDLKEIDNLYYTKPYYLIPDSKNKKSYVLLREALKKTNKVGVSKVIIRTQESLSLILPHGHALLLYLIHFEDEIRHENDILVPTDPLISYKISDKEIKMAVDLIKDMSATWTPKKYHNEYREALKKWLDQQTKLLEKPNRKGQKNAPRHDAVIDFVSLLKESMGRKKHLTKTSVKKRKV